MKTLNMKTLKFVLSVCVVVFSGCSQSEEAAKKALKPLIAYQCDQEIQNTKFWKNSAWLLSEEKRNTLKKQACDCVGENALNDVSAETILKATVDDQVKDELIQHAMVNSLKACVLNMNAP